MLHANSVPVHKLTQTILTKSFRSANLIKIDLKSDFDLDLLLKTTDFLITMYGNQTNGLHLEN